MITEHLSIQEFQDTSGPCGKFELSHLADPRTVQLVIQGRQWWPDDFTPFGEPILSAKQYTEFCFLDASYRLFAKRRPLTASISYEPIQYEFSRAEIDTTSGIQNFMETIRTFHDLLQKRRFWYKETKGIPLQEFVLFGQYLLDRYGGFWQIQRKITITPDFMVCEREIFDQLYGCYIAIKDFPFPQPGDLCPLCGVPFLIKDLQRNELFQYACGSIAHCKCHTKDPTF